MTTAASTDEELMELASVILGSSGYTTQRGEVDGRSILICENHDNVVALASPISVQQLLETEPIASRALGERLQEANIGNKRWDAYVVLLCASPSADEFADELTEVTHDIRNFRRIVRVGVEPTNASVERALRPLLPLPPPPYSSGLVDPLDRMRQLLEHDGIEPEQIDDALRNYLVVAGTASVDSFAEDGEGQGHD